MYIPEPVIYIAIGYVLCPVTAYIYVRIKEYRETKKLSKYIVEGSIKYNTKEKPKAKVRIEDEHS